MLVIENIYIYIQISVASLCLSINIIDIITTNIYLLYTMYQPLP